MLGQHARHRAVGQRERMAYVEAKRCVVLPMQLDIDPARQPLPTLTERSFRSLSSRTFPWWLGLTTFSARVRSASTS